MGKIDWQRAAAVSVTAAGAAIAFWFFCKYLFLLCLPFLFAFLLAYITRAPVLALQRRTKCPRAVAAVLVTLGALVLLFLLLVLLCSRLVAEAQNLLAYLVRESADENGEISRLIAFFRGLEGRLPLFSRLSKIDFLRDLVGDPKERFAARVQEALSALTAGAAAFVRRLPGVALSLLVTLIACLYVAAEYETVTRAPVALLPRFLARRVPAWSRKANETFKRCAKAYFLLFLLTFSELTLGFLLLRVRYPVLIAFFVALLDILPVFGVGTVLVPWGILALILKDLYRGAGLLVLYAVITVVRQIIEPHLLGKSLGVHPLLLLISFYAGVRLFGAPGLVLGPVAALALKSLLPPRREKLAGSEENIENRG